MRISKQDALTVAQKMTENRKQEIKSLQDEIKNFAYNIAFSSVKKEVMNFYLTHKNYFKTSTNVFLSGTGMTSTRVYFETPLPSIDTYNLSIIVNASQAKKLTELINKKEDLEKSCKALQKDIEVALISLSTTTRIESEFKEAVKFLPVKVKAELTVNIKDIKKRL